MLVATFESVFALHVNVERIGRYLQVFHERAHAGWEHVTMEYGRRYPGGGSDPLFGRVFILAILSTSSRRRSAENRGKPPSSRPVTFVFIYRVRKAQSLAASSRVEDLRRFEALLASNSGAVIPGHSSPDKRPISRQNDASRKKRFKALVS